MNLLRTSLMCVSLLTILSCQTNTSTTIKSVEIDRNGIRYEGKPYTGTVWSEDSSTYSLSVDEGSLTSYTLYHANGQPAIVITTADSASKYYNESGESLTLESFVENYGVLADEVTELAQRIESRSPNE